MRFDLLSDVHLDEQNIPCMSSFVQTLIPKEQSNIFVYAGDFGYCNRQNIAFLDELKKYYQTILFIYGNNDLKCSKTFDDVGLRVEAFEEEIMKRSGIHRLTHEGILVEGIRFIGSDLYYDFEAIKKRFNLTKEAIDEAWKKRRLDYKHRGWIADPEQYAQSEKHGILEHIDRTDVIVTHGPPDYFVEEEDNELGFFRFCGLDFKDRIKDKIWCFGHSHQRLETIRYGCCFYNASYLNKENNIITIHIERKEK